MMDFDTTILNTTAGKDVATNGIIRFELKDDTAGVAEVSDAGILTPSYPGAFSIRAVCFESTDNYKVWLENKEDNADYLTAASSWVTVNVQSTEATASTQKELNNLLSSDIITKITISAKDQYFIISKNDYSDKTLVVDTPNTKIDNQATFKEIYIKSASKWNEYAVDNSFTVYNCGIEFNIDKQAQVKYIKLDSLSTNSVTTDPYNNNIVMNVNGTLRTLDVMTGNNISISGTGNYVTVNVMGSKSNIRSSIPIILNSYVDFDASLLIGSEHSFLFIYGDVTATVENITTDVLHIYNDGDYVDLKSSHTLKKIGKTFSSNPINTYFITKQTPIASSVVHSTAIIPGKALSTSVLHGTFYYNSMLINGTLTWCEPDTVVNSTGYYDWIFTPTDSVHYNAVSGKAYVVVN